MKDNKKVKESCSQICQEEGNFNFNYIFNGKLIAGSVVDVTKYNLTEGVDNKIIGMPNDCANLFYMIILMNAVQIKEMLKYSSEQLIHELTKKLRNDKDYLDELHAPIKFKIKTIHKSGKA
jgi:hypothetical protein